MAGPAWPLPLALLTLLTLTWPPAEGHGRLIEPPSRATMWRYGFDTPPNYNDHELYCGGYARQWEKNKGKCGVCGDPWDLPRPRPHEAGGKYGNGIIVRRYRKESAFTIRVELTANHKGYFEFTLCPNNAPHRTVSQDCLDKYILRQARTRDGRTYGDEPAMEDPARYYPANGTRVFEMKYLLPKDLTCTQCVLQWRYIAGNNWGMCTNGTGQVGCGPQEEFRACADISVQDATGAADGTPFDNEPEVETTSETTTDDETFSDETPTTWWLLHVAVVCGTLVFMLLVLGLLLCYFSRRDQMRKWWAADSKVPFWEKFSNKKLPFWRSNAVHAEKNFKHKDFVIPPPVAPPRVKRSASQVGA